MCCILLILLISSCAMWLLTFLFAGIRAISMIFAAFSFCIVAIYIIRIGYKLVFPKQRKITDGYEEQWFGKEPSPPSNDVAFEDTSIRPFKISVPDEVLSDLKARLENTRYEDPVEDSRFLYGFNPNTLRKVVDYWKNQYDWRKHERMLNQFPQYKTRIEGIDVHFMHVKPNLPADSKLKVLPLLMAHGWPGSFVEFYKIIPLLTTPRPDQDFVFEVVCPSIPGFGFSESPHQKGFTARAAARIFLTLMERVGHPKFYVQGGDWGSRIVFLMARFYSPRILGLHMNLFMFGLRPWEFIKFLTIAAFPFLVSKAEYNGIYPLKKFWKAAYREGGYFHIQSTKPDTLGCAMADSPAGMAAYLLEKFPAATDPDNIYKEDGGLTEVFTLDKLLTNVMVYWVNNNFTAAARFYKENLRDMFKLAHEKISVHIPSGIAVFPKEIFMLPRTCMSQQLKNLISYNIMPRGGHFAALEEPELLADDIWQFVESVESLE